MTGAAQSFKISRVNDTGDHITCLVCALKLHILQTRLTGHTTCKTCASEVTNQSVVWFLVKNRQPLCTRDHLDQGFFSSEISEISPETGFLGPLWKILIPFKIIQLYLNFKSDITFTKLRILKISCPTAWSGVKLSRGIHLASRVRFLFFFRPF
jgi:hypothetical protein